MPTFEYQAQGADGKTVNGVVVGSSLDQALQDLTGKGLQILKIGLSANPNDPLAGFNVAKLARPSETPRSEAPATDTQEPVAQPLRTEQPRGPEIEQRSYVETSVVGPLVGKISLNQLLFFFRQLSVMLEAGVPFVQSLDTLVGQARDPRLKPIIAEIKGHVEVGRPMSAGMQRYPEVFTPVMLSLLRAGEEGGFLDQSLAEIANYLEREIALRNLYKRVTFYPKLELVASVVIIIAANYIIESIGRTVRLWSPLTTPATWIVLTPILVMLFLFTRVGLANSRIKYNFDAVIANIPYLGGIVRQMAMAKFGRAMGALHRGGLPIQRCVQLSADACGNEWLRSMMQPASKELETGAGVAETLQATGAFSPIVMNMVATGEHTGNLDKMVDKMADFYEEEADTKATQLAKIVGVVVTLLVCIYIGMIIINFWSSYSQGLKPEG